MTHPAHPIETAVLAGGCFWCLEAAYQMVNGVTRVTSGYTGGRAPHPTYEQVMGGSTGHAEAVRIEFNPTVITYRQLLEIFWVIHDPTTLNRQDHDIGPEYRSAIFYADQSQHSTAQASIKEAQAQVSDPIVTELVPLGEFYEAEPYHQNYFRNHPDQAYCQIVINPKLHKLKAKYAARLKREA
jgi:peptide-methionine (S)-S-oxide reductase